MALTLIGDISHGEKYTNKEGEEKWKNTPLGTLFRDDENGEYVVKYLGQWCKVWPAKMKQEGYQAAKQAAGHNEAKSNGYQPQDSFEDDTIPF